MARRRTLGKAVSLRGQGVRSGREMEVRLEPAPFGDGLRLTRRDTGEGWPVHLSAAFAGPGYTAVGTPQSHVAYVEHLLAACAGLGVSDAHVLVDGPEIPLLDGSALSWVELLGEAGLEESEVENTPLVVAEPVIVQDGLAFVLALPSEGPVLTYILDHPHPLIGRQWAEFRPAEEDFATALAPARTFITEAEARSAQAQGLLRGGSEANAIVIYENRLSAEPGLPSAFARHKLLDLSGDLYLLGRPLQAAVTACQSGHRLNHELARALLASQILEKPSAKE